MKKSTKCFLGILSLAIFMAFNAQVLSGQTTEVVTFTTSGTWVVPLGVTSVKIEAWGGGGGGAIGNVANQAGNGGGGGAYQTTTWTVDYGEPYFITVGTGGSGLAELLNPANKNGKASSVNGPVSTLTANGGIGGTALGGGGNGGIGTYDGGKGGSAASGWSGAGGGAAGNAGSGGDGGTSSAGTGGLGLPNLAPYIGGAGGVGRNSSGVGSDGNIPGGGGAGGKGTSSQTRAGGYGARGQVVITFTYDQCENGTLTWQQTSGAVSQTVEQYYPIEDIVFNLGGNATGVEISGLPTGVTGSLNLGVLTIAGTPLIAGTFTYTLTTTGTPDQCQEGTVTGTLTVNPEPVVPGAGKVVFSENGTWQVPVNVSTITIQAWGGGGGGGAASNGAGGGGGGGAYATVTSTVTAGDIFTITVGSGGSGGTYTVLSPGTSNGVNGSSSFVEDNSGTIITATGGSGGGGGLGQLIGFVIIQGNGDGGIGGFGNFNGGNGGNADNTSGSGGGGAGSGGNGSDGSTSSPGAGGLGDPNIPPFVGGDGGAARVNNGQGNPGGLPGAGGSGARAWQYGFGYGGGDGARGQVIISYVLDGCSDGTLTLTSDPGSDDQTVCLNLNIDNITYIVGGNAEGAEVAGLPAGVAGNFNGGIFTISGFPSESGTFMYTVTTTGTPLDCDEGTVTGTITVNPAPSLVSDVVIEFNTSDVWPVPAGVTSINVEAWGGGGAGGGVDISFFGIGGGGGGGAYAVKSEIIVVPLDVLNIKVAGIANGNAADNGSDGDYSTITGLEDVIYAAGGKGGQESASIFQSGSAAGGEGGKASDSKGDCTASGVDGKTGYRFQLLVNPPSDSGEGGAGATISGGAGGEPVGDFIGNGNPGEAPGGGGSGSRSGLTAIFSTSGGAGGGGKVIISFSCPEFSLDLTSATGTDNQLTCLDADITEIVYEIKGGATGAQVTGLPAGVTGSTVSDVFTISGTPTIAGIFIYTITTTGHVSLCSPATVTGTITVDGDAPQVVAKDNTIELGFDGTYELQIDDVLESYSDDGTGIDFSEITIVPESFTCTNLGQTIPVTITVPDNCGFKTIVTSMITVAQSNSLLPWIGENTHTMAAGTSEHIPCTNNGTFRLTATGQSTTTNDVHHFVYQDLTGNGDIIARLADVQNGGYAGVMMRKSCEPNAPAIYFKTLLYNPNVLIGTRTSQGQAMRNASQVAQLIRWMKIQRNGTNFRVFTSYNGTTWQQRYSGTINMTGSIQAGIFTESVRSNRTSIAWFDHVEVVDFLKSDDLITIDNLVHENTESLDILIFPNPADERVTIVFPYSGNPVKLTISNPEGQQVISETIRESETQLNVQSLRPGIWFLRFESNERVEVRKLIIQ